VFYFEHGAKVGFGRSQPICVGARCGKIIHAKGSHGGNGPGFKDVDARVQDALLPPIVDKPVPQHGVELAMRLSKSVEQSVR
jgi:hypothetical protein